MHIRYHVSGTDEENDSFKHQSEEGVKNPYHISDASEMSVEELINAIRQRMQQIVIE